MRFLILSGNTGGGHNTAAKAIKEYFESQGHSCDIRDALAFMSEGSSYIISNGHVLIYKKAPKLFGFAYKFEENHPAKENGESFIYSVMTLGAKKMNAYLEKEEYDAVICTHIFSGMILTEVCKKYKKKIKSYLVATDYTCSPGVSEVHADGYFIPHENLREEFLLARLEPERVIASGIPVSDKLFDGMEKSEAKKKLGLPADKKTVLLMSGSMGCGPIKKISESFDRELPDNCHIVVICGNNKKLFTDLSKRKKYKKTTIVGFTSDIKTYLDAAEVVVTKAGGLSTTEALVKHKPLILMNAVPGCELRNIEFLTQEKLAVQCDVEDLVNSVELHLTDENYYAERENAVKVYKYNSVKTIYDYIINNL